MANQEWDKFGKEIKRTVQDAVESRNFDQLNQTISRTINDAVNTVAWNVKNYSTSAGQRWSNYQYREPGAQIARIKIRMLRITRTRAMQVQIQDTAILMDNRKIQLFFMIKKECL